MREVQGGRRSARRFESILTWMKKKDNNSRRSWNVTKMCLLGTKGNWAVALLGNISWTHKVSHLARCLLVDYPTGKMQR